MIMLINRTRPIQFRAVAHSGARLFWSTFWTLRRMKSGGRAPRNVIRNLAKELNKTGVQWAFSYHDIPVNGEVDVLWVLNGARELRWAVENKNKIGARQLWAGPTVVTVPDDEDGLLLSKSVDRFIVPCAWVADFFAAEAPALRDKLFIWPVGIDTDFWKPVASRRSHFLIYNKFQDRLSVALRNALERRKISVEVITYGRYAPEEYRALLNRSWGMAWLSAAETQGLAMLEALATNVPVLAWDRGEWSYRDSRRAYRCPATSVPYFEKGKTGEIFKDELEFDAAFARFQAASASYAPREFIFQQKLDLAGNVALLPTQQLL